MGFLARLTRLMREGASIALAPAPDPRLTHLTSHQRQRALLDQVAAAGREVTAAKERLQSTADSVRARLPAMEDQARQDVRAGREQAARLTLQRRQVVISELDTLQRQLAEVEKEEIALSMIEQRLSGQIQAFAARQEVIRARFSAAEAQVRINEAMTGVANDFAGLGETLEHAERTTEEMQARAAAIDRLVSEGDLDRIGFAPGGDAIDERFRALSAEADVEGQLDALRKLER
jgi:phage shock protein A